MYKLQNEIKQLKLTSSVKRCSSIATYSVPQLWVSIQQKVYDVNTTFPSSQEREIQLQRNC